MSTATDNTTTERGPDPALVEQFAGQMFGTLSGGATALMISIGHRTGLFDTMSQVPPSTSSRLAAAAGLHERYVREWLGAMTTARVVVHDPSTDTYALPLEHAVLLTRAAAENNLASLMQFIPLLAQVEDEVVRCFTEGGGVGYEAYGRFQEIMAEQSAQNNDASLVDRIVPLVSGLPERLRTGIRVADLGCGQGRAMNLLADAFPASEFVGYDISEAALEVARAEATEWGLENVRFELRDVADLNETGTFGAITAFDAIHDQAQPTRVLAEVAAHLDSPDGVFLMVDMRASSNVDDNLDLLWAPYLYTVSTMHCMTVSLASNGEGLGTAWGRQRARRMLAEAGFSAVREATIESDFINTYYIARR